MSTKRTDIATILGKGLVGAIPFVGPLAAEIVGAIIPNQRIDRLESLLQLLESKISEEDQEKVKERITSQESVDLMEDGFIQASRALSEERKDYIASLLKNSLTSDELEHIEHKRLLTILGEMNDLEVLILKSHAIYRGMEEHNEFWEKHEDALTAPIAHLGSAQEEIDRHTLFQTHRIHLANIGLLRQKFKKPKRGESPEFDEKTGMIKAQGYEITPLGRLLLRSIDQGREL
ncbi:MULTISPECIES: hypothetical protein [Marinomonas]|uniref:DUF4393 domain-containing protein n=1 Tax=Marinomonas arctica TaxID=383750 RepID=A0A7H1J284_9GAMM|nr:MULTISPECIES: hypothetical protein [Marinomonas]MCS7488325.1 hypothetical protein [Marinomonas sp. BSi20414]QNT04600.1 hypothetical protein IBG28_12835 [Marinomonas arctica]GGN32839.1 hypothetical protein GCM10011350_27690 [Marinomonas arctica]